MRTQSPDKSNSWLRSNSPSASLATTSQPMESVSSARSSLTPSKPPHLLPLAWVVPLRHFASAALRLDLVPLIGERTSTLLISTAASTRTHVLGPLSLTTTLRERVPKDIVVYFVLSARMASLRTAPSTARDVLNSGRTFSFSQRSLSSAYSSSC